MVKRAYWLIVFLFFIVSIYGIYPQYNIDITLNTKNHTINGKSEITISNSTIFSTDSILFEIYPNAFRKGSKLYYDRKSMEKFPIKKDNSGYLDIDSIKINNQSVQYRVDFDLLCIYNSFYPKDSLKIEIFWKEKIPKFIGREGYINDKWFEITQWYPKLCVFEEGEWNVIRLREIGEFYGEYGSFNVNVTIPANYLIEGTGDIKGKEGEVYDKIGKGDTTLLDSIYNSEGIKTVTFHRDSIHDFAFVVGKDVFLKDTITDKGIKVRLFIDKKNYKNWEDALLYASRGLDYYGKRVGPYIYNKLTVAIGISGAGGMEYPGMIIIAGKMSGQKYINRFSNFQEMVIVHETGHQWFYGMMGNNEMDEPWLDEGLNSYFEYSYLHDMYKRGGLISLGPIEINDDDFGLFGYITGIKKSFRDFSATSSASIFNGIYSSSYSGVIYAKGALLFRYFEGVVGRKKMDEFFSLYYKSFNLKHPHSDSVYKIFNEVFGVEKGKYLKEILNDSLMIDVSIDSMKYTNKKTFVYINNKWDNKIYGIIVYEKDTLRALVYPGINEFVFDNYVNAVAFYPYNNLPEIDKINNRYPVKSNYSFIPFPYLYGINYGMIPIVYPYLVGTDVEWYVSSIFFINRMMYGMLPGVSIYFTPFYKTETNKVYFSYSINYAPIEMPDIETTISGNIYKGYLSSQIGLKKYIKKHLYFNTSIGMYVYYDVKDTIHYEKLLQRYWKIGINYLTKKINTNIYAKLYLNERAETTKIGMSLNGTGKFLLNDNLGSHLYFIWSVGNETVNDNMYLFSKHSFDIEYTPDTSFSNYYFALSSLRFPSCAFFDTYYLTNKALFGDIYYKWKFLKPILFGGYDNRTNDIWYDAGISLIFGFVDFYFPIYTKTPYYEYNLFDDIKNIKLVFYLTQ